MRIIGTFILVALLSLVGCGGGSADTETPVADVKAESTTMSVEDLKSKATQYQKAIQEKMAQLEPLKEKLSEIPMTQMMGDEAKALKDDISAVTTDLNALKERLQVYLDALKEKGESVSEYLN